MSDIVFRTCLTEACQSALPPSPAARVLARPSCFYPDGRHAALPEREREHEEQAGVLASIQSVMGLPHRQRRWQHHQERTRRPAGGARDSAPTCRSSRPGRVLESLELTEDPISSVLFVRKVREATASRMARGGTAVTLRAARDGRHCCGEWTHGVV